MVYEAGVKEACEENKEAYEENEDAYWFIFKGYELLVYADPVTGSYHVPAFDEIKCLLPMISDIQYLGGIDGKDSYIASLSQNINIKGFFTAEHESGEICVDGREIEDAAWYFKDDLPELPSKASVAMKLIEAWMNRK